MNDPIVIDDKSGILSIQNERDNLDLGIMHA